MKLSNRLQALADLVPVGQVVGDIGTDHGHLPCYLVGQGISPKVIAADVNALPLAGAKQLIGDLKLEAQIETRLGDGLGVLIPGEVDVVTISGMGGALMVAILEAQPLVVAHLGRLILQPNMAADQLRIWAEAHQWHLVAENLVLEDGRFYEVLAFEPGAGQPLTRVAQLLGPLLLAQGHPLLVDYWRQAWQDDQFILGKLVLSQREDAKLKAEALEIKWQAIKEALKCRFNVVL